MASLWCFKNLRRSGGPIVGVSGWVLRADERNVPRVQDLNKEIALRSRRQMVMAMVEFDEEMGRFAELYLSSHSIVRFDNGFFLAG